MIFESHLLSPPLDKHIEAIFHFKDFMPDHGIERVVPTGHIFLLFELDGMTRQTFKNDTLQPDKSFTKAWISGMHKHYISISAHQQSEMLVIQFKASGAYPFLHFPIHQINEQVVQAEELLGEEILILRKSILETPDPKAKCVLVEHWLKHRFVQEREPSETILALIEKLKELPSLNSSEFNHLIKDYPYSQKHLIDQFKKYVGLTPKYFQRILRFNEILTKINQKEKRSWTRISYECGYADQAHFIKEFKHFSGFNPQAFIQGDFNNEVQNFFPLDR